MEAKIVLFLLLSSITYIKATDEGNSSSTVVTESTATTESTTLKPTSEAVPVTTVAPGNFSWPSAIVLESQNEIAPMMWF
uniref:Uncharacterized protein n=1 Tax=Megaselia scalaris TaxID=36166 RepID=T1H454_MEGSC